MWLPLKYAREIAFEMSTATLLLSVAFRIIGPVQAGQIMATIEEKLG